MGAATEPARGRLAPVSVVIAAYQAEETVGALVDDLVTVLDAEVQQWEIIVVDDGSTDDTWATVTAAVDRNRGVRGQRLVRNFGQHNALLCGLRLARHGTVVTMDDDFQHPPSAVPTLVAALHEADADLAYGVPARDRHRPWRRGAATVTKPAMERIFGMPHGRAVTSFRAFPTHRRDDFAGSHGPVFSLDVLLSWTAAQVVSVPVRHDPRRAGRSTYSLDRLVTHTMNMATAYSVRPLRLAAAAGAVAAFLGLVLLGSGAALAAWGSRPVAALVLGGLVAALGGLQLVTLGFVGEHMARANLRTQGGPSYVISASRGDDGGGPTPTRRRSG